MFEVKSTIILTTPEALEEYFNNRVQKISEDKPLQAPTKEIIDSKTLRERLNISEPTELRLRKRKKLPFIYLGSSIRYEWNEVLHALQKQKSR
jgi:hypothetical protein